ncbi:MAG: hypothetical protein CMG69_00160 [Candidatus Marinimicrobia bacterium]|nr:hypothetical protein [Candidatus Neomarinimicrobiota bacterium]|tara:strand:- start:799 stop:1725 length:927 start_codon:yes stop_codon:yes gene_type:complete
MIEMKIFPPKLLAFFSILINFGCISQVPSFSGESAFQYLEKQCSFGPRNPGSEGYELCKSFLIDELSKFSDSVFTQKFNQLIPGTNRTMEMTNIIGKLSGSGARPILLGAHWDTRPTADHDANPEKRDKPILGANDGASGVAVLLEIARVLSQYPHDETVYIVFFDAEDLGIEGEHRSYALGAQYFAKNLPISKPELAIILDMVGDANLELPIERNSYYQNPQLVKYLWNLADEIGLTAFEKNLGYEIYDDHVPLWENANIPAIDIIDFNYPNRWSNFWHTHDDVPENCSAESLNQVGTLLVHYIYDR